MSRAPEEPQTAEALARHLHAHQVDKVGAPYVDHLAAVVTILLRRWPDAPAHAIEAAWLHDAIEDTDATAESLAADGVSPGAIWLVQQLTRPKGLGYMPWIGLFADTCDVWAIRIKLADNEHNSDMSRGLKVDMARTRYAPARRLLEAGEVRARGVTRG